MELSERERMLLSVIVNDKFSVGAFSGMIFNALAQDKSATEEDIKRLIKIALSVRLTAVDMAGASGRCF